MKYLAWSLGLSAFASSLFLPASKAEACSPPLPGLSSTSPVSGATFPANAALFFNGFGISLDGLAVTVDGVAATLTPATDVGDLGDLAARVSPTPGAGAIVRITGRFCADPECAVEDLTFTASAADVSPPAAPTRLRFDVHDYADTDLGVGSCQSDSDAAWYFRVAAAPPAAGDAPVVLRIQASGSDGSKAIVFTREGLVSGDETTLVVRREVDPPVKDLPEAYCFTVTTRDTAGNDSGAPVETCLPCRARIDPTSSAMPFEVPAEPTWTNDDVYDGGPCDDGSGGEGGEDGGDGDDDDDGGPRRVGGCGCTVGEGGEGHALFGGLALLVAVGARLGGRGRRRAADTSRQG